MELVDTLMHTKTIRFMERSKLVWTEDDMTNLKNSMQKIVNHCTRGRAKTKRIVTNVTVFALLLKDIPMGCKNTVLSEPHLKNHYVNCLSLERNTRQPYKDNLAWF